MHRRTKKNTRRLMKPFFLFRYREIGREGSPSAKLINCNKRRRRTGKKENLSLYFPPPFRLRSRGRRRSLFSPSLPPSLDTLAAGEFFFGIDPHNQKPRENGDTRWRFLRGWLPWQTDPGIYFFLSSFSSRRHGNIFLSSLLASAFSLCLRGMAATVVVVSNGHCHASLFLFLFLPFSEREVRDKNEERCGIRLGGSGGCDCCVSLGKRGGRVTMRHQPASAMGGRERHHMWSCRSLGLDLMTAKRRRTRGGEGKSHFLFVVQVASFFSFLPSFDLRHMSSPPKSPFGAPMHACKKVPPQASENSGQFLLLLPPFRCHYQPGVAPLVKLVDWTGD